MTAVSMIAQAASASLLTDGALYDDVGTIRAIASKVATSTRLRMAIAGMGRVNPVEIANAMPATGTQGDAMRSLPAIAKQQREANRREAPQFEHVELNDLQLFVAMWSDDTDRPECWIISTETRCFGAGYRPYSLVEVEQLWIPGIKAAGFDPARFDPIEDGRRVLVEQRGNLHEDDGRSYVGGFGELTTVTRNGIAQRRLVEWPDKVGEVIRP